MKLYEVDVKDVLGGRALYYRIGASAEEAAELARRAHPYTVVDVGTSRLADNVNPEYATYLLKALERRSSGTAYHARSAVSSSSSSSSSSSRRRRRRRRRRGKTKGRPLVRRNK